VKRHPIESNRGTSTIPSVVDILDSPFTAILKILDKSPGNLALPLKPSQANAGKGSDTV
jgi:hypothetical protein